MYENISDLLESVKEFVQNDVKGSDDFNIFKILAVEHREIYFCRFIGGLLDPRGTHGAGNSPLELFFKYVLKENTKFHSPWVNLEETISDNRRVDIVIHDETEVYPIEVKIFAGDQEVQLSDYHKYYFKDGNGVIYYLTPDKHKPSESSKGDLKDEQIKCISFADVSEWLNALCEEKSFNQKDICRQFKAVVDNIREGYEMSKEVVNKVFEDKNDGGICGNINAALEIIKEKDNILKKIKDDFICKLKEKIEEIEEENAEQLKIKKYTCDDDKNSSEDKRRCLKISRNNITIGYICIESNLYITTDHILIDKDKWKDQNWTYIDYGKNHFNFKQPGNNVIQFAYGDDDKDKNLYDSMKNTLKDILNNISDKKTEDS